MKLYKYIPWRPFDKECDLKQDCLLTTKCYTKDNLLKSILYFSSPDKLNDPFDTLPFVDTDMNTIDLKADLRSWAIKKVMEDEHVSRKTAIKKVDRKLNEDPRFKNIQTIRENIQQTISSLRISTGVSCFTTNNPNTLLMWAHYGDKHMGICLEFDFPEDDMIIRIPKTHDQKSISKPFRITYSEKLPPYNFLSSTSDELGKSLLTKSIEWSYENEYRILSMNYVGTGIYPNHILTGIYAGYKMEHDEFIDLKKTINKMYFQPHLYHMKKDEREFKLNPVEIFS